MGIHIQAISLDDEFLGLLALMQNLSHDATVLRMALKKNSEHRKINTCLAFISL